jgi:large subunit ribosomal protein L7/L12
MAGNLDQIVEQLSTLSVLEAAELVKMLEEKWGVSAAAPVAMAAMPGAGAAAAEPVEEKTEFDVIIKDPGAKKIDVIKVIRQLSPGLGLGEAKALAETAGGKVMTGVGKDAATEAKKKLEEAGASIELG